MPRLNVIVLDKSKPGTWGFVFWADVPVARQPFYANPAAKSLWKDATTADNTALQNGSVVEQYSVINTPGFTTAQLQSQLQTLWAAYQAQITAYNPWNFYGTTWDGTTWTVGGVS